MKMTKSLFLAFAGLGLFACSNEDVVENGGAIEGDAVVSVKINNPVMGRAIDPGAYSTAQPVDVQSLKLVLTAQTGGNTKEFIREDNQSQDDFFDTVEAYQFEGVRNPSKMEVYINTDKASGWTLAEVVNEGLAAPLYASATADKFVNKGDTDKDEIDEYVVSLAPEHNVARLEFGGISHKSENPCMFTAINIDGLFLNNISGTEVTTNWVDAQTEIPAHSVIGTAASPVEFEIGQTWPAAVENVAQCYGYNILPVTSGELPVLTVCFSGIEINTSVTEFSGIIWPEDGFGYATVKDYKLDLSGVEEDKQAAYKEAFGIAADDANNVITKFPAGYVYQVKSLEIPDEAIGQSIGGGEDVHIMATVTVKDWTIVHGSVDWN